MTFSWTLNVLWNIRSNDFSFNQLLRIRCTYVYVCVSPLVKANNNDNDTIRLIDGIVNTSHWANILRHTTLCASSTSNILSNALDIDTDKIGMMMRSLLNDKMGTIHSTSTLAMPINSKRHSCWMFSDSFECVGAANDGCMYTLIQIKICCWFRRGGLLFCGWYEKKNDSQFPSNDKLDG